MRNAGRFKGARRMQVQLRQWLASRRQTARRESTSRVSYASQDPESRRYPRRHPFALRRVTFRSISQKAEHTGGRNPHSIVTAITARSALEVTISGDGWGQPEFKALYARACGRPMGLTRTVPASPGYSELHTYGCRECGVWVTEGSTREISARTRSLCPNEPFKTIRFVCSANSFSYSR